MVKKVSGKKPSMTHMMPGGMMMSDAEMKKKMGGKMPPKGMPPKKMGKY